MTLFKNEIHVIAQYFMIFVDMFIVPTTWPQS